MQEIRRRQEKETKGQNIKGDKELNEMTKKVIEWERATK